MWKIALGFVVFAGLALFILMKSGGDIDMGGEKHGAEAVHAPEAPAQAPAASAMSAPPAVASQPAASSAPAEAASAAAGMASVPAVAASK